MSRKERQQVIWRLLQSISTCSNHPRVLLSHLQHFLPSGNVELCAICPLIWCKRPKKWQISAFWCTKWYFVKRFRWQNGLQNIPWRNSDIGLATTMFFHVTVRFLVDFHWFIRKCMEFTKNSIYLRISSPRQRLAVNSCHRTVTRACLAHLHYVWTRFAVRQAQNELHFGR